MRLLGKNIGVKFSDLGPGKESLGLTPKTYIKGKN